MNGGTSGGTNGGESGERSSLYTDRAALLGTTLAAVVALTFGGSGPWDWVASAVGLALLAVLIGFFRLPSAADGERVRRRELFALSAVAALCATLVLATPLQLLLEVATPVGPTCAATGEVAAASARDTGRSASLSEQDLASAAAEASRSAEGTCLGAAANHWLWVPPIALVGLIFVGTNQWVNRRS
jgi:hypothetical protein